MLSGNRNFEGRINPEVRANYLMSPPLVVAYALAGRIDIDLTSRAARQGNRRQAGLPERHLADARGGRRDHGPRGRIAECSRKLYAEVFEGRRAVARRSTSPRARPSPGTRSSTYVKHPPYFDDMPKTPPPVSDIKGARVLAVLGDSVTTDHISPAGSIKKDSPAGKYLLSSTASSRKTSTRTARVAATTRSWCAAPSPTSACATSSRRAPKAASPAISPTARR